MKQIQMILGHSDYSTIANIYFHLDYSDKIPATEMMKEIIYGKDDKANQGKSRQFRAKQSPVPTK